MLDTMFPLHTCRLTNVTHPDHIRIPTHTMHLLCIHYSMATANIHTSTHGMPLPDIMCQMVFTTYAQGKVMLELGRIVSDTTKEECEVTSFRPFPCYGFRCWLQSSVQARACPIPIWRPLNGFMRRIDKGSNCARALVPHGFIAHGFLRCRGYKLAITIERMLYRQRYAFLQCARRLLGALDDQPAIYTHDHI